MSVVWQYTMGVVLLVLVVFLMFLPSFSGLWRKKK
jgi:hypothetical protein